MAKAQIDKAVRLAETQIDESTQKYRSMGRQAFVKRLIRQPPLSHKMYRQWWFEGYDEAVRKWRIEHPKPASS